MGPGEQRQTNVFSKKKEREQHPTECKQSPNERKGPERKKRPFENKNLCVCSSDVIRKQDPAESILQN
jgi:hypothetical protein